MKLGELRKIIADIDTVYDNCDITCYESNGNLGYASIATTCLSWEDVCKSRLSYT